MSQRSRNRRNRDTALDGAPPPSPSNHSATQTSAPSAGGTRSSRAAPPKPNRRLSAAGTQQRRTSRFIAGAVVAAVVGLALFAFLAMRAGANQGPSSQNVAGSVAWPAAPSTGTLADRLSAAGLPLLNTEGEALHIHAHLDIFVNGQAVQVPADIGIDQNNGTLSPLHTHDTTGVIHVESPTVRDFTLGEFFQVWGVPLSGNCIGSYCASGTSQLQVWVNGAQVTGDPSAITLHAHDEIVIAFGTPAQMPSPVPSSYTWTGGL